MISTVRKQVINLLGSEVDFQEAFTVTDVCDVGL